MSKMIWIFIYFDLSWLELTLLPDPERLYFFLLIRQIRRKSLEV